MGNVMIIGVLAIVIILALHGTIKHLKGEGGCCGGGSEVKIKKQRLTQIDGIKIVEIEGMTCEHCKQRVENALNVLNQVNAKVNLKEKKAIIKFSGNLSDQEIETAIRESGYKVKNIKNVNC